MRFHSILKEWIARLNVLPLMIDKPIDLLAQIEVAFDGSGSDAEHGA